MNGGSFYVAEDEMVVDPFVAPVPTLTAELLKCEELVQRDFRYAQLVAGASKMPMSMIWVARNQDQPVTDADLAALKDIAWTELVKKRYLPGLAGTTTVRAAAASMLEIVREMNLQRRRFLIMGLHEQVEASEIQLILHLCQAEIIRTDNYRATANRYRRHDKLFEAFALAVGAFVCASAPFTLGSGTGRYERDLQFEYKKTVTALFVWALRRVNDIRGMDEDYVARISRLIVVRPEDEGDSKRVGFLGGDGGDSNSGRNYQVLLDAVAEAQNKAESALSKVVKLREEGKAWMEQMTVVDAGMRDREARMSEQVKMHTEVLTANANERVTGLVSTVKDLLSGGMSDSSKTGAMEIMKRGFADELKALEAKTQVEFGNRDAAFDARVNALVGPQAAAAETRVAEMERKFQVFSQYLGNIFSYIGAPLNERGEPTVQLPANALLENLDQLKADMRIAAQLAEAHSGKISLVEQANAALNLKIEKMERQNQMKTDEYNRYKARTETKLAALGVSINALTAPSPDPTAQILQACKAECTQLINDPNSAMNKTLNNHAERLTAAEKEINSLKKTEKLISDPNSEINRNIHSHSARLAEVEETIERLEERIEKIEGVTEGSTPAEPVTFDQRIQDEIEARVSARLSPETIRGIVNTAIDRITGGADSMPPEILRLREELLGHNARIANLEANTGGSLDIFGGPETEPPPNASFDPLDPRKGKRPASARDSRPASAR